MQLSLQQAAQQTGRNRTSILRAIKRGEITGTKDAEGNWTVDAAELSRVYGAEAQRPTPADAHTDALVAELKAVIEDLRRDRDRWHAAFEAVQRRLPTPTPADAQPDASPAPEPSRLRRAWRWLRTTG
jgi:hypothetical protein